MALDMMTPEGRAEAERLARQLPTGDRTTGDLGPRAVLTLEEQLDAENFIERYDRAVARVVAARKKHVALKAQTKSAKDELEIALEDLQALRKAGTGQHRDEPRQLPLHRT